MTNEEAIEVIKYASAFNSDKSRLTKALNMAIKSLQNDIQIEDMERALAEEHNDTHFWRDKTRELNNQLNNAIYDLECLGRFDGERCKYCIHDNECEPGEMLCSYQGDKAFEWRGRADS